MPKTLLEWLEDFISMLEDAETPVSQFDYWIGYRRGCEETQDAIRARLQWAVDAEKEKINAGNEN